MVFKEVFLDEIDMEDETFRVRLPGIEEGVLRSIERVGVVNPPWLLLRPETGGYRVIMGFRRIEALRALGREAVLARIIGDQECSDVELMEATILENLSHGPFNPVEVSRALAALERVGVSREEIMDRYLSMMGLKGEKRIFDGYLLLSTLPEDVQRALADGEIKMDSVERVRRCFGLEDGVRVLRLIRGLRLGVNRQRELVHLLDEILRRDGVDLGDLLGIETITSILESSQLNAPQKAQNLITALRGIRSPRLTKMIEEAREEVRRLGLDPSVSLELSPYLEERRMRVSFGFRTREEYLRCLRSLEKVGKGEALEELIRDLFGRRKK